MKLLSLAWKIFVGGPFSSDDSTLVFLVYVCDEFRGNDVLGTGHGVGSKDDN